MIVDVKEIQIKGFAVDFHSAKIDDRDGSVQIKINNCENGPSDSAGFIAGFGRDVNYFLEALVTTRNEIIKININTITFHVDTDSGDIDIFILSNVHEIAAIHEKPKRTKVDKTNHKASEYPNGSECKVSAILTLIESEFGSGALFAVADVLSGYGDKD